MHRIFLSPWTLAWVTAAVSIAILAIALAMQFLGGLAPCPLCIWQRWPYVLGAFVIGAARLAPEKAGPGMLVLAGVVFTAGAGLSGWHAGIEYGWWTGPATCQAPLNLSGQSTADLLAQLEAAPLVRCDRPALLILGLSLAGWSVVALLGLAAGALLAASLLRGRVRRPNTKSPPSSHAGDSVETFVPPRATGEPSDDKDPG